MKTLNYFALVEIVHDGGGMGSDKTDIAFFNEYNEAVIVADKLRIEKKSALHPLNDQYEVVERNLKICESANEYKTLVTENIRLGALKKLTAEERKALGY